MNETPGPDGTPSDGAPSDTPVTPTSPSEPSPSSGSTPSDARADGSPADAPPFPGADAPPVAPPPAAERPGHDTDVFFDRIRDFGAVRVESGRWAAGVGGGLARRFDVDPLLVRGVFVVLTLISGLGAVLYGLAWAFLPQEDGRIHAQELLSGRVTAGLVGAGLVFLLGLGSTNGPRFGGGPGWELWPFPGVLVTVALIAFLGWWFGTGRHRENRGPEGSSGPGWDGRPGPWAASGPPPTPGASQDSTTPVWSGQSWSGQGWSGQGGWSGQDWSTQGRTTQGGAVHGWSGHGWSGHGGTHGWSGHGATATATAPVPGPVVPPVPPTPRPVDHEAPLHALTLATVGLALLTAAGVALWDRAVHDLPGSTPVLAGAAALAVVALGVVAAGLLGRRCGGLAPIGVLLAVAMILTGSATRAEAHFDRTTTWQVGSRSAAAEGYHLDVGRLVVDLTSPALKAQATARPMTVSADVGAGEITIMLPDGARAEVHSRVGLGTGPQGGTLTSHDGARSGPGVDTEVTLGDGDAVFLVDAKVGVGAVNVVDAAGKEIR